MEKIYNIEVDCANCANLTEECARKIEGVKNAYVNFFAQKMTVEFEDGADEKKVLKAILKACRKIEPDFEMDF